MVLSSCCLVHLIILIYYFLFILLSYVLDDPTILSTLLPYSMFILIVVVYLPILCPVNLIFVSRLSYYYYRIPTMLPMRIIVLAYVHLTSLITLLYLSFCSS